MEKIKNLLIIDTASNYLKVSISIDGLDYFVDLEKGFKHIENLMPAIDTCIKKNKLQKKKIEAVGVCEGPGSFTGIRIGISAALGISFALGIPCFGFSKFDIYKFLFRENNDSIIIPIVDAKKNRYFCCFIEGDNPIKMFDISFDEILNFVNSKNKKIIFVGKDFNLLKDKSFGKLNFEYKYKNDYSSTDLLNYSKWFIENNMPVKPPKPIYLRKSEAEIALLKKKGKI